MTRSDLGGLPLLAGLLRIFSGNGIGTRLLACSVVVFVPNTSACGASYQSIYEGEVRFEHCYRLDEEPKIPLTQRRECWREWTKFYTYGQTRDRLEYALRRQRELTERIENPNMDFDGMVSTHQVPHSGPLAAPPPVSPFVPPPHVHDGKNDGSTDHRDPTELLSLDQQPPNHPCVVECLVRWRQCTEACAQKNNECRTGCDTAFRTCGARCFEP